MSVTLTQDQVSAILQGVQAIASALQSPVEAPQRAVEAPQRAVEASQSVPEPSVVQPPYPGFEERLSPSGAFSMRTYVNSGEPQWGQQDAVLTTSFAGLPAHAASTFGNLYVQ